jgi:hypothetical protein
MTKSILDIWMFVLYEDVMCTIRLKAAVLPGHQLTGRSEEEEEEEEDRL